MRSPTLKEAIQNVMKAFPGSEIYTGPVRERLPKRKPRKKRG